MPPTNNLPLQLTNFVGREREVAEVISLLTSARLVTFTGVSGSGKTRLALKVASDASEQYPGGVWFADLSPLADPTLVPQAVAVALGLKEQPGLSIVQTIIAHLAHQESRPLLLVLDNCEHLLEACAQLVNTLLRACPSLTVLATSIQSLDVSGEFSWRVPPLTLPSHSLSHKYSPHRHRTYDPTEIDLAAYTEYEAIKLFVDRARLKRPEFALTMENAPHIALLCQRLDGLPLAIELAAAWVRLLPIEQIVARLNDRFRLLAGGSRMALPKQQALIAAMDWSYSLLSEEEQLLLCLLSVFPGGATLEALGAVWHAEIDEYQLIDLLSRLIDKSLLLLGTGDIQEDKSRYHLLATVQEYGHLRLRESGQEREVRYRHAAFFLSLAELAAPEMRGPQQIKWMDRLGREQPNLRSSLVWAEENGEIEMALRLSAALWRFWGWGDFSTEGRDTLLRVLSHPEAAGQTEARAEALYGVALLMNEPVEYEASRIYCTEALSIYRRLGNKVGITKTLIRLGNMEANRGEHDEARSLLRESLALADETGDKRTKAFALNILGEIARLHEDCQEAQTCYSASLALFRELGDKTGIGYLLHNLGCVALCSGSKDAEVLLRQSLELFTQLKYNFGTAMCFSGFAGVWLAKGTPADIERAALLLGATRSMFPAEVSLDPPDQTVYEQNVTGVRARLGATHFEAVYAEGQALSVEDAVAIALGAMPPFARTSAGAGATNALHGGGERGRGKDKSKPSSSSNSGPSAYPNDLTRREVEVLRLVVEGLTNAQIAERLFLSRNTIHAHLHSIYSKVEVSTRSAAARFATSHNLV